MPEDRLLIVSNRLPITIRLRDQQLQLVQSSGGLATGLRGCHDVMGGLWIGWPGEISGLTASQRAELAEQLDASGIVPVHLSAQEVREYYEGFSNGVIWPLCHYLLDRIPLHSRGWHVYRDVNAKFADHVARHYRTGDLIWVHDYQLTLLPGMLRERLPDARIGFFLHIPWPSAEVFRILPWREEVVHGMLGANLIGFHTRTYARHFADAVRSIARLDAGDDRVRVGAREVRFGAFPMGIDVARFRRLAEDPETQRRAETIRREAGDRAILLGVDRLDYTKGLLRRLLAFERLLEQERPLRDRVRLVQVAVPSRTGVAVYRQYREELDQLIGRINGSVGTVASVPIHYLYRAVSPQQLVALYRAADVMLVTPLRDGMNLVAKEFVASRVDEDGVLLLSEFAGAAEELSDAMLVNPYDVDGMMAAMRRALAMSREERGAHMRALRSSVLPRDVHQWAQRFIATLHDVRVQELPDTRPVQLPPDAAVKRLRSGGALVLLLDYDGTLTPLVPHPEQAAPDRELLRLLDELAQRAQTAVHLVSGRPRETLDDWFGGLPLALWAEHGLWHRGPGADWQRTVDVDLSWYEDVRRVFACAAADTPGSHVEEKSASLAWHYRQAAPELAIERAASLRRRLSELLATTPAEVLDGSKVIEVRPSVVNKGVVVARLLEAIDAGARLVAMGDDRTDEDMFAALRPTDLAVHVGPAPSRAALRLMDPAAARSFLRALVG
ncbi:MAG: bifunctional alpha,alpha-trehalose-phosphate synthase (UDP-forming)/trehalose-phosphatase [Betaproteobacteria bacterium]